MPRVALEQVELQLAEPRERAFTDAAWVFELKLDGFRLLAERVNGVVRLQYRRGKEVSATWPEVTQALEAIPGGDFLLDGELVIQDEAGRPVFQQLLKRSMKTKTREIAAAAAQSPAVFFAFDVISAGETDLRRAPLTERKVTLAALLKGATGRVRLLDFVEGQGEALLEAVKAQGLEGIVAKKKTSVYAGGRSSEWLKVPLMSGGDFAVVGFAAEWGALHLAIFNGQTFEYACKVGLTPANAKLVKPLLTQVTEAPPCVGQVPAEPDARWVTPTLVVEIRYKQWPLGLAPREPQWVRLRDDKAVHECFSPHQRQALMTAPKRTAGTLKNAEKLFYPGEGITKAEVVQWYRTIAPRMLTYLRDRPLLMERYPDGITGKSFFQRNLMAGAPKNVRVVHIRSESEARELDQLICDSAEVLEWCATQAALVFHIPSTRVSRAGQADWAVIDFDPKGAPFAHVRELAMGLHALCDEVGLPHAVKTSGSSGLHVFAAVHGQLDDAGAQSLAQMLALVLVQRHPTIATTERVITARKGRVYVDALQNYGGKTIAAPFSLRAKPGAPVSLPIGWHQVPTLESPQAFTVRNAMPIIEREGDPMAQVLEGPAVPLLPVIERLQALTLAAR